MFINNHISQPIPNLATKDKHDSFTKQIKYEISIGHYGQHRPGVGKLFNRRARFRNVGIKTDRGSLPGGLEGMEYSQDKGVSGGPSPENLLNSGA